MDSRRNRPRQLSRRRAWAWLVGGLLAGATGVSLYVVATDYPGIVTVELGGTAQPWPVPDQEALRGSLWWDFALIAGYGTALVVLIGLGRRVFYSRFFQALATAALACAIVAILADLLGNVLLLNATYLQAEWLLQAAAAAVVIKFCSLAVASPVAFVAAGTVLIRSLVNRPSDEAAPVSTVPPPPVDIEATRATSKVTTTPFERGKRATAQAERWVHGYKVPGIEDELDQRGTQPTVGFCVSGGGIRSAALTLGALQGLREQLLGARYLVSVSGGGYMAGAMQLGLQSLPEPADGKGTARPNTIFQPGSVEEDHLRRHSHYLADGLGQWLVALGVILRGLLFSLLLVTLTVVAAGLVIGFAYRAVPLVDLAALRASLGGSQAPPFPAPMQGVTTALAVLGTAAVLLYVFSLLTFVNSGRVSKPMRLAKGATAALLLVATLGVGLPGVVWASVAVTHLAPESRGNLAGGIAGTVLVAYVGTLAGMLWRQRHSIAKWFKQLRGKNPAGAAGMTATGFAQRMLVAAVLTMLAVLFLLVLGAVAVITADAPAATDLGSLSQRRVLMLAVLAGALIGLAVVWTLVDQTWVSLHPFYRRRLASAFAVRPVRRRDGQIEAWPYHPDERTTLSTYAKRVGDGAEGSFPEVIFAAAANLSGQERTPPGRRAVSFTQTAEWIGGPDVGYARTSDLEEHVSDHIARDLTVQAAVAVSGAAFASAMGRQARAFQTLFALTNARLGTWLPNPAFIDDWSHARAGAADDWTIPAPPRLRRLPYLFREVLGRYPYDDRFLFVTDGGHYDNLGLLELLRRRCTRVYCIDASGDTPPVASTLAESIALAYEELGVVVTLEDQWGLVPGGGDPVHPTDPLAVLNGRLSRTAVVKGIITYPQESGMPSETRGTIVVAKALLTRDMPYQLLSHAVRESAFPGDSTGDQWFDHAQFSAYSELGRELARQVEHFEAAPPEEFPSEPPIAEQLQAVEPTVTSVMPDSGHDFALLFLHPAHVRQHLFWSRRRHLKGNGRRSVPPNP